VIHSRKYRTRKGNVEACKEKLHEMLEKASKAPKIRKKTKPTRASKEKRLEAKKKHSQKKRLRARITEE